MADLEKIVKLIFEGDSSGLSQQINIAGKDFDKFSSNIQDATGPLADFGEKVALAEAALIGLGAAGLVYAFNKAKEFEAGAIELDKVLSEDEGLAGGLEKAKQKAVEFSDTYGESSTNILSSIAEFRQANFDLTESIELSEQALRLKIAGDLDAAESSQYLKQILSGFAAEAGDAGLVIDQLNAVSNNYNSNVRELAVGLGDLSGVADTVNMSYAETIGVLTPVIEVFGSGSEAARALRTGLIRMVDDTPAITSAMESIGVSQYEANGELKNAYEILGEVSTAFEQTDESQQLFIAGQIFGKEQASKMVQVIRDWDNVLEITETALNGVGSAQLEVDKRLESMTVQVDRAIQGWINLNAEIGGKFSGSATGVISAFTDIENALRNSLGDETFDVIWDALNSFFADTETLLKTIAKNLPEALAGVDFSALVQSFKDLGVEVGDALDAIFGGDLDLTTVQGLEDAIQKIVDLATKMTEFTEGFIKGLNPLFTAIGKITTGITEMDAEGTKTAGNMAGWAKDINVLFSSLDTLKGALYALTASSITTAIAALGGTLGGIAGTATGIGLVAAAIWSLESSLEGLGLQTKSIPESFKETNSAIQNILDVLTGKKDWWTGELIQEVGKTDTAVKELKSSVLELPIAMGEVPEYLKITTETDTKSLDDLLSIPFIEDGLDAEIRVNQNIAALEKAQAQADKLTESKEFEVVGHYENGDEILMEINESVPAKKPVEVELTVSEQSKIDLERDLAIIETSAENMQSAMEWTAKVDIAEVEAAAKTTEAAFDAVASSVSATAGAVSDMVTAFISGSNEMSQGDKWFAMDQIEAQLEMQEKALESQLKLNEAKTEEIRLRNEKIENGETAEININMEGASPAVKMVMWEVINEVQIEANARAQEFLMGMPS